LNNPDAAPLQQKDFDLLAVIQSDFPIEKRPFKKIAGSIDRTEREVIDAIGFLKENGTIRTFGPVFDARSLGYTSTLVAATVEKDNIDELAHEMSGINEITHCYLRDQNLNVWFTISALNRDIMDNILKWVSGFSGVSRILDLPSQKVYKINAVFGTSGNVRQVRRHTETVHPLNQQDRNLVKLLQDDFPLVDEPFKVISGQCRSDESQIIETIDNWLVSGVIRRFGARLNHRRAGYTENAMVVWKCDDVDELGQNCAELTYVSHCYRRKQYIDWPYELYTMVHARSREELDRLLNEMKELAADAVYTSLKTVRELKKTSMKYFVENGRWDTP